MKRSLLYICIFIASVILADVNVYAYNTYEVGDKVQYKGEDYYVIKQSYEDDDYVTLLKSNPLTVDELNKYGVDEKGNTFTKYFEYNQSTYNYEIKSGVLKNDAGIGLVSYYVSDTCNSYSNRAGCNPDYSSSDIKKILDNWSKQYNDDLKEIDGYKIRLLTQDELVYQFGFSKNYGNSSYGFEADEELHNWISSIDYSYWTMSVSEYDDKQVMLVTTNYITFNSPFSSQAVRPVINVKKCSLGIEDSGCLKCNSETSYKKITLYKKYSVGDVIEYNGENYYVIENSSKNTNYVTLLKKDILTKEEISKYKGDLEFDTNPYDPIGHMPYYSNDDNTCYEYNKVGCITDYNSSFVKVVVDNWASNFEEDLVEVDGYKARLLTIDNLLGELGYDIYLKPTSNSYGLTEDVPNWIYDNISNVAYWTMSGVDDSSSLVYIVLGSGNIISDDVFYHQRTIRPVINLNKCSLEDNCTEVLVADGCVQNAEKDKETENNKQEDVVDNPPTYDNIIHHAIIVVVILIVITITLLVSFKKLKKANN